MPLTDFDDDVQEAIRFLEDAEANFSDAIGRLREAANRPSADDLSIEEAQKALNLIIRDLDNQTENGRVTAILHTIERIQAAIPEELRKAIKAEQAAEAEFDMSNVGGY